MAIQSTASQIASPCGATVPSRRPSQVETGTSWRTEAICEGDIVASDGEEVLAITTWQETVLEIVAGVTSIAPWFGGPISVVLSGISISRKIARVQEFLLDVAERVRDLETEDSRSYVESEDFAELLERTLHQIATERSKQKRKAYAAFLAHDVGSPGEPYDEKIRHLRTLEEMQTDHIQMLQALLQEPDPNPGMVGSVIGTLRKRLAGMTENRIEEVAQQLTDMRVARLENIRTTMTGSGAEELSNCLTPYGGRFVRYILS